jgi:2-hydroxy-6-oxonona-2,4-dienedioate hydrolase
MPSAPALAPEILQYPLGAGSIVTRVLECGGGEDHIVFVHGLGARADRWRVTLPAFAAAGYHTYAFDLPGHGLATKGASIPLSVPAFADFLTVALDELGIQRAFFVGTSLGAHVAATVASTASARVRGLILVGAVGLVPLGAEAGDAIRRNVQQTSREAIAGKLAFVLANPGAISPTMVEEEWRVNNSPGAREAFEKLGNYIAQDIDNDNIGAALARMTEMPTLLVWGAKDKAVSLDIGKRVRDLLNGPELVVIDDAGHVPYLEQPAPFNAAVLKRLDLWRGLPSAEGEVGDGGKSR